MNYPGEDVAAQGRNNPTHTHEQDVLSTVYQNPIWPRSFADPYILKVRGRYYAYATEPGEFRVKEKRVFPILVSDDLVRWREAGKAMEALGEPYYGYWAPEVTEDNGQFLLYYAVHTSEFICAIRVAVADRPEGPFIDSGHDLTSHLVPWAIDPHVFRDFDGQWYLYITIEYWNDPGGFVGSGNAVIRLHDPFSAEGVLTRVTPPRHAWELFEAKRESRGGVDWYTVEGPTLVRHRGRYYEMFSGGCYYRDNYAVSYATSDVPAGSGGMRDNSWQDWDGHGEESILVRGNMEKLIGPGHNSLVYGPNNVDLYIAYHAWEVDMAERRPCLDRLYWHGDEMWTPAPTSTPQPAPHQPRLLERFQTGDQFTNWLSKGGNWYCSNEEAIQAEHGAVQATLQSRVNLGTAWMLEINLRKLERSKEDGERGMYGIQLQGKDGAELEIVLTDEGSLVVSAGGAGKDPLKAVRLPDGIRLAVWHQLLISLAGSLLRVQLDGLLLLSVMLDRGAEAYPYFALLTRRCGVAFSAISLTDHFRDEFLDEWQEPEQIGWHALDDRSLTPWQIRNGTLEQTLATDEVQCVIKGPEHEQGEFGATLRLLQIAEEGTPAFGLILQTGDHESLYTWFVREQTGWLLQIEDAEGKRVGTLPLEDFDLTCWHTLRLVRQAGELCIAIDGPELLVVPMATKLAKFGLVTRGVGAAFMGVWLTAW